MSWKFWDRKGDGSQKKLPGPKDIPYPVGRHQVVDKGQDPDWVWALQGVVLPKAGLAQRNSALCIDGLKVRSSCLFSGTLVLLGKDAKEVTMGSLFKLTGILLLLLLLVVPLTGCDTPPWDSGMTLVLKVDTPEDGATVTTPTVTVSGRVTGTQSATAKIKVNDADVFLKDGKFSTLVTLNEGANVINIAATSGSATPNEKLTVTYAPAKQ